MFECDKLMANLGYKLAHCYDKLRHYIKPDKISGYNIVVFMEGRKEPYFFWQRVLGDRSDMVKFELDDVGEDLEILEAFKSCQKQFKWVKEFKEEYNSEVVKELLNEAWRGVK